MCYLKRKLCYLCLITTFAGNLISMQMLYEKINNLKFLNESIKAEQKVMTQQLKIHKEKLKQKDKEVEKYKKLYLEETQPVYFDKWNLKEKSNASVSDLRKVTKGTGLEGLEEAYVKAEKEYGVSAIFLLALSAHESYWGKSDRAIYQNNLTGYDVTSDEAQGRSFYSKEYSILETAKLLGKEYLSKDGLFFGGSLDIYTVNKTYCPVGGTTWSDDIVNIANEAVEKIDRRI